MDTRAAISGATLCIVLVQITRKSAPAPSSAFAASPRIPALRAQSPLAWQASISAKSTLYSSTLAECRPPSLSLTTSLTVW